MSASNLLARILETNRLIGSNFKDWLQNLKIILSFENWPMFLTKTLPLSQSVWPLIKERLIRSGWTMIIRLGATSWHQCLTICKTNTRTWLLLDRSWLTYKSCMVSRAMQLASKCPSNSSRWRCIMDSQSTIIVWQWSRTLRSLGCPWMRTCRLI